MRLSVSLRTRVTGQILGVMFPAHSTSMQVLTSVRVFVSHQFASGEGAFSCMILPSCWSPTLGHLVMPWATCTLRRTQQQYVNGKFCAWSTNIPKRLLLRLC